MVLDRLLDQFLENLYSFVLIALEVLQQNIRAANTTTWVKDKHNLKFGAEFQVARYSRGVNYDDGQVRFTGAYANAGAPLNGPCDRGGCAKE